MKGGVEPSVGDRGSRHPASPAPARFLAPGKIVIIGEYAVLQGAPALVTAIDRGVACEVWPEAGPLVIETPDGDDRFVRPALAGCRGRYVFSAWNPVRLPGKPGFGGSAAACVVACLAAGRPTSDARDIHRRVQGGGSGIDVAAAQVGGTMRFQDGAAAPVPAVAPLVVYSGQSARTGPRVRQYLAWRDARAFVRESTTLVEGFFDAPIDALRHAGALLEAMADAAGLEYITPGLARIRDLAHDHGGAAKASGAGGGDCAVALLPDPDAEAAFLTACQAAGLPPISVRVAPAARRAPRASPPQDTP
jgi:phosphomevalonate kinase